MGLLDSIFFTTFYLNGELVSNVPRAFELVGEGIEYDDETGRARFDLSALATSGGGGGGSGLVSISGSEDATASAVVHTVLTADEDTAGIYEIRLNAATNMTGTGQLVGVVKVNGTEPLRGTTGFAVYPASESGPKDWDGGTNILSLADGDVLTLTVTAETFADGLVCIWGLTAQKLEPA